MTKLIPKTKRKTNPTLVENSFPNSWLERRLRAALPAGNRAPKRHNCKRRLKTQNELSVPAARERHVHSMRIVQEFSRIRLDATELVRPRGKQDKHVLFPALNGIHGGEIDTGVACKMCQPSVLFLHRRCGQGARSGWDAP